MLCADFFLKAQRVFWVWSNKQKKRVFCYPFNATRCRKTGRFWGMLILVTTLKVVQIFLVIGFPLLFVMIHGLNGSDHRLMMMALCCFARECLILDGFYSTIFVSFMISCLSFYGTMILIWRILMIHTMYCERPMRIFFGNMA